ncbi:MAG: helix-turn-helix domain-containing protein [Clostridium sp.]
MEKCTMTPDELAEYLGIGRSSAYKLIGEGQFTTVRVGRRILIPVQNVNRWLDGESNQTKEN